MTIFVYKNSRAFTWDLYFLTAKLLLSNVVVRDRWCRTAMSAPALRSPGGRACPRKSSDRLRSPAGSAPGPTDRIACRQTGSYSTTPCCDIPLPFPRCADSWMLLLIGFARYKFCQTLPMQFQGCLFATSTVRNSRLVRFL